MIDDNYFNLFFVLQKEISQLRKICPHKGRNAENMYFYNFLYAVFKMIFNVNRFFAFGNLKITP